MEELRRSLTLYAYNILGSWEDARDVVQDVFLKFSQLDQEKVDDKKSYLIRMVVNLAIDRKRKLKRQLNNYVGPWLPEPISTDDPHFAIHKKEILSYSMLVLLEKLDARQRAVFILKEAFDYEHDEIARVLGITAENSRKILSRAKRELDTDLNVKPDEDQMKVLHRYLNVLELGDMDQLEQLLSDEISITSDGGGKASASRNIIRGFRYVAAFVSGLNRKVYRHVDFEITHINHQPAVFYVVEGQVVTCQIFAIHNQRIERMFFVRNPDKLASLQKEAKKGVTFPEGSAS